MPSLGGMTNARSVVLQRSDQSHRRWDSIRSCPRLISLTNSSPVQIEPFPGSEFCIAAKGLSQLSWLMRHDYTRRCGHICENIRCLSATANGCNRRWTDYRRFCISSARGSISNGRGSKDHAGVCFAAQAYLSPSESDLCYGRCSAFPLNTLHRQTRLYMGSIRWLICLN